MWRQDSLFFGLVEVSKSEPVERGVEFGVFNIQSQSCLMRPGLWSSDRRHSKTAWLVSYVPWSYIKCTYLCLSQNLTSCLV
jgi:hypothetical protein